MKVHPHQTRYARLVAAFAASAFALLVTVSMQLQSAGTTTASVANHAVTLTDYQPGH